ncbi:hypothetical protein [Actinophytocola sp.]|uniref:hypothetical protein n=1 Tax=Actinophytocola sp. TaxID=1872138 RepID=UPI002ED6C0C4
MPHGTTRLLGIIIAVGALTLGCAAPNSQNTAQGRTSPPAQSKPQGTTTSPTPSVPAKPYTVEELAATVGCTPEFQGKTLDFRQAVCNSPTEDYVLLDFATAEGMRAWLDTAMLYGGTYLVGERWLLSSRAKETMETLSTTLGGVVEESPMRR